MRDGDRVEPHTVDPDVNGQVTPASDRLAARDDKQARRLTDAAHHTHDRAIEQQVDELAAQAPERALVSITPVASGGSRRKYALIVRAP
jgi:hypothetical protein